MESEECCCSKSHYLWLPQPPLLASHLVPLLVPLRGHHLGRKCNSQSLDLVETCHWLYRHPNVNYFGRLCLHTKKPNSNTMGRGSEQHTYSLVLRLLAQRTLTARLMIAVALGFGRHCHNVVVVFLTSCLVQSLRSLLQYSSIMLPVLEPTMRLAGAVVSPSADSQTAR